MSTPLTLYTIPLASTTLATAMQLISAGATGAQGTNVTTLIGTGTGWGEIVPKGTTSGWAGAVSQGAASGQGLLFDSSSLEGQQILAGSYTATINLKVGGTGGPSLTGTLVCRYFVRSSGGVYTQIGTNSTLSNQTIGGTSTSYVFPATNLPVQNFNTGDKLYVDFWFNCLTSTATTASSTIGWKPSSLTTSGWTGSQIVTPGYQAQGTVTTSPGNPYGTTIYQANGNPPVAIPVAPRVISDMQTIGMTWLRAQYRWDELELVNTTPSTYDPTVLGYLDGAVAACNYPASGSPINIILPIQNAPWWHNDVYSQYPQNLVGKTHSGYPELMNATAAGVLADFLSKRYNGVTVNPNTGKPYGLAHFEAGNEGFDDNSAQEALRDSLYAIPVLHQCALKVRANSPNSLLGLAAMLEKGVAHTTLWTNHLYVGGTAQAPGGGTTSVGAVVAGDYDYVNYHYYNGNNGPDVPSGGTGATSDQVTFLSFAQTIKAAAVAAGATLKDIWVTEVGWTPLKHFNTNPPTDNGGVSCQPTDPGGDILSTYITSMLDEARQSGIIKKVFWFTVGNLTQSSRIPAYTTYQNYVQTYAQWSGTAPAGISVSPTTLSFTGTAGAADPPTQKVTATNTGGSSGNYTTAVVMDNGTNWLFVSPTSGTLAAGANTQLTITASNQTGALAAGTYTGHVTVTIGANSATVQVSFTVQPSTTTSLTVTPTTLSYSGVANTSDPATQAVTLSNTGTTQSTWSATATTTDGNAWLIITPGNGTLAAGNNTAVTIAASNMTAGLPAGTYTGKVTFTLGSATAVVNVTLTVAPSQVQACLSINTTSLTFNGVAATTDPAAQAVTLSNCSSLAGTWTATPVTNSGGNWLFVNPVAAQMSGLTSQTVVITASNLTASLAPGTYTGVVIIVMGSASVTVTVTLVVQPGLTTLTTTPVEKVTLTGHQSATPQVVFMFAGDTLPLLQVTVQDDLGNPTDLSGLANAGLAIKLQNTTNRTVTIVGGGAWTISTPATAGIATYQWNTGDTAIVGEWKVYVSLLSTLGVVHLEYFILEVLPVP